MRRSLTKVTERANANSKLSQVTDSDAVFVSFQKSSSYLTFHAANAPSVKEFTHRSPFVAGELFSPSVRVRIQVGPSNYSLPREKYYAFLFRVLPGFVGRNFHQSPSAV